MVIFELLINFLLLNKQTTMKKNYLLSFGLLFLGLSISAQKAQKMDRKIPAETPKSTPEVVYCIDGVITKSPVDFLKIKSEDIYYISVINDQNEITKSFARKGEYFKSVIVVQTIKKSKPVENVVSDNNLKVKAPKN
jgi:hypothetical protein